jgi:DNA-binding protein YbaB
MANDLMMAKLTLSKEEIVHIYQGGILSVKIKGKKGDVSLEISCGEIPERKGMRIRFKNIDAE